jgi:hypothetical protein
MSDEVLQVEQGSWKISPRTDGLACRGTIGVAWSRGLFPMTTILRRICALVASAVLFACPALSGSTLLTVFPADVDRAAQVVTFRSAAENNSLEAVAADGSRLPVQVTADGSASFVVPFQKAGETLRYTIVAASAPAPSRVVVEKKPTHLHVALNGQAMFQFRTDREELPRADIKPEYKRAGYIHPVFSPSGKIVTDDYPSNHVHHHGIWTPWTRVTFQGRTTDFWNMGAKKGKEDLVTVERSWSGPVHGGFAARLEMTDLTSGTPIVAMHETWVVTAYDVAAVAGTTARVFDLELTQTCATNDPVVLPKYHYGGFGIRGAAGWNGRGDAALFLTSEGVTDRVAGNDSRVRWCWLGGRIDGEVTGTAVLGHPENFRAPQPVRLHPNMPYFSLVPQLLGEFAIEPGQIYRARFRFVVADGAPDKARLDAFWNGYAVPTVVKTQPEP